MATHIEVKKITEKEGIARDEDGRVIYHPHERDSKGIPKKMMEKKFRVETETISIHSIKSVRPWRKTEEMEEAIPGHSTLIYINSPLNKERDGKIVVPQMIINESYDDFIQRSGFVIRLKEEHVDDSVSEGKGTMG